MSNQSISGKKNCTSAFSVFEELMQWKAEVFKEQIAYFGASFLVFFLSFDI